MARATAAVEHDFDVRKSTPAASFRLGGRAWHCRASSELPWSFVRGLQTASADEDLNTQLMRVEQLFRGVIVAEEVDDFMEMVNRPNSPLTMDVLPELLDFVTKKVLRRPTTRPSASAPGSPKTRATSKAGSSSRVTPRKRSTA